MRNIRKIYNNIKGFVTIMVIMVILIGCEETKRFEISSGITTPPGQPIFIESEPLNGGARVFFLPPADENVLYVEASYIGEAGKRLRFAASYFAPSVDVLGFGKKGEHTIELCAVDRAGNRSTSVTVTVESLEPPAVSVAKSVKVLSSFASMMMKWRNDFSEPVYVIVDLSYIYAGARREYSTVLTTSQSETRLIDNLRLYADEQVSVKVSVKDKYNNVIPANDTVIVLLTDAKIDKEKWSVLPPGSLMGGILQVNGLRINSVIDGVIDIDVENFFHTYQDNPWNLIIDMGEKYEISRIVTHQRWSGYFSTFGAVNFQGNLYRGDNVLTYNMYRWDDNTNTWELMSRRAINEPVVNLETEYTTLGKAGDMAFIYPEEPKFSAPTRYFRLEALDGKYISEITLYGR